LRGITSKVQKKERSGCFHEPDTLLRRLKSLSLKHVVDALNEANRIVLTGHAKDGTKMAIDFTEEPYREKLDMYVTRSKYKNGTDRFHTSLL
jgi:hypothetical protein